MLKINANFSSESGVRLPLFFGILLVLTVVAFSDTGPNIVGYFQIPVTVSNWRILFLLNSIVGILTLLGLVYLWTSPPRVPVEKKLLGKVVSFIVSAAISLGVFQSILISTSSLMNQEQYTQGRCAFQRNSSRRRMWFGRLLIDEDYPVTKKFVLQNSDAKQIAEDDVYPDECRQDYISVTYVSGFGKNFVVDWKFQ